MLKARLTVMVCAYALAATAAFAQNSYVFQLPGQTGLTQDIVGKGDDDFSRSLTSTGPAKSYAITAAPTGTKFFVLAPGGIYSADATISAGAFASATLSTPTPISAIAGVPSVAQVTPDGKYLLAVSTHFYILDATTGGPIVNAPPDTGVVGTPVGVAVSHDAKTAWVLSNSGFSSSTIMAVNLANFQITGQMNLPAAASSITLSPGNLLYVSGMGTALFEVDPASMALTSSGQIPISGVAGPLQFTPDGRTAYFLNGQTCTSCSPLFKLDITSHAVSTIPPDGNTPPVIDQVLVAGNDRVFAFSKAKKKLWTVTPTPLSLTDSSFSGVSTAGNVAAVAVSNEHPTSRYLYLSVDDQSLTLYRVNLGTNQVDRTSGLDPHQFTVLTFVPIPARTGGSTLFQINASQNVPAGTTTMVIAQVLDDAGHPVLGAPVTFSTSVTSSCAGVSIATPSMVTTAEGWAQTAVTVPSSGGTCSVKLTAGTKSVDFQLSVGPGSGTVPQMSIDSGDGQLLRQNQSTFETGQPLTVKVTDAAGNPLPGVAVDFAVTGIGSLSSPNPSNSKTGADGKVAIDFVTGTIDNGGRFELSKVTASSVFGSVDFDETAQDAKINSLVSPKVRIVSPASGRISIPEGGVGVISTEVIASDLPGPIPNVGLRLEDSRTFRTSSDVSCQGLSRSDANGISLCNALVTCQTGLFLPSDLPPINVVVGEYQAIPIIITVTKGLPSLLKAISPSDQSGNPSDVFSLRAIVTDGCGHPAVNFGNLVWSAVPGTPGSVRLANAQTTTDINGVSSVQVTLGQTAGLARVQLSAPGLAPIIFNLTTNISVSGISLVSGGGQSAVVGAPFNPLIFFVRDGSNNPLPNLLVTFSATGGATVNPTSLKTDGNGQVQTVVTAGSTPGNITVTATVGSASTTATLSSHLSGAQVTKSSFTNAASGTVGMTPCGFVTVTGTGVAPGVQGVVSPETFFFGAYPYSLAGLSITVNNIPAPIQAVANDQFGQRANFQAPCELTGDTATVVVTANGVSTTVTGVPVFPVQPGIFTYTGSNNKLYGAVIREADGSYVTSANQARQGEKLYVVVTGLGQATPTLVTNSVGTGTQNVNLPVAVFLGDKGLPALSARYLFGWVGAYLVEFQVPADAPTGPDQKLIVVALVNNAQDFVVGNTVLLPGVIAP
jgi:uncharacterized protein (TIGR03437 family)